MMYSSTFPTIPMAWAEATRTISASLYTLSDVVVDVDAAAWSGSPTHLGGRG